MKLRAIIFDIYKTVLNVAPPPADREEQWQQLARRWFNAAPRLKLKEFVAATETAIAREHAAARSAGVNWPEIFWPEIASEVLPEVAVLAVASRDDFLLEQQSLFHTVTLMPGAAALLRFLSAQGMLMGVASNAQPYTLRELDAALAVEGLAVARFARDLSFWSFEHGFSKPDPHVFRLLTARLKLRGVRPAEALMVGDRVDNDIAPANAAGWQTWQLSTTAGVGAGDWGRLGEFIAAHTSSVSLERE
jgi:FMN phosphatase YigB (HAD superfamily)